MKDLAARQVSLRIYLANYLIRKNLPLGPAAEPLLYAQYIL